MLRTSFAALCLLPAALAAQRADGYKAVERVDEFTKARTISVIVAGNGAGRHQGAKVKCVKDDGSNLVNSLASFSLEKLITAKADTAYALYVGFTLLEWIFEAHSEAMILADTTLLHLQPVQGAPTIEEPSGATVQEGAFFHLDPDDLRTMASATALKARVGSKGECDLTFDVGAVNAVREFVAHEVPQS